MPYARDYPDPDVEEGRPGIRGGLLSRDDLRNLPAPAPLIDDTLDRRTIALLSGYWGTGKSFIALDWACCIATGKAWQGRATRQGKALYVAAEGAYGLDRRVTAWENAWHREVKSDWLTVYPDKIDLLDSGSVRDLVQLCAERRYALVVLDTIARCIVGADENSAGPMGQVVDSLDRIKRASDDGTVLGVHHTGKDRITTRGSGALESGVDTAYKVEGDALMLTLTREKRKDGPRDDRHTLRLLQVDLGADPAGIPATSCVVESTQTGHNGSGQISERAGQMLEVFADIFADTGATKVELRNAVEQAPATFSRSLSSLLRTGALVNTGTDQRPFYKITDSIEST